MAVVNIAQAAALSQVSLARGIALSIVTVDNWIANLPFIQVSGGSYTYSRETSTVGSAAFIAPGGTSSQTQAVFTRISEPLTRIEALAQVDNFAAIAQSDINDQIAVTVAAKAKGMARLFQQQCIVGNKGSGITQFNGLRNLIATAQRIDPSGTTSATTLSFALMDRMLASITAADGRIDFIVMNVKMINKLRALYRALGGTSTEHEVEIWVPDRMRPDRMRPLNVLGYAGVPIYRNDWCSLTETVNASDTATTEIYSGQWEDITAPSLTGLAGLLPERLEQAFLVYPAEQHNTIPEWLIRMEMYTGLALHSDKALTGLMNIDPNS